MELSGTEFGTGHLRETRRKGTIVDVECRRDRVVENRYEHSPSLGEDGHVNKHRLLQCPVSNQRPK